MDTFQFSEASKVALIGSSITMLVAIGGWIFSYLLQRDAKRTVRNERKITRLEDEIRARIALEKAACEWVAELTSRTSEAVKRDLRNHAQERSGLRPKMSDSDLTRIGKI